jgi:hypothetical protein
MKARSGNLLKRGRAGFPGPSQHSKHAGSTDQVQPASKLNLKAVYGMGTIEGSKDFGNRALARRRQTRKRKVGRRKYRTGPPAASLRYIITLGGRYGDNLLAPFNCTGCGRLHLDPVGWNGPGLPLCADCADGGLKP